MIVLRAFGHNEGEIAARISTSNKPTGVSVRMLYKHLNDPQHKSEYQRLLDWALLAKREKQVSTIEVTAKSLRAKMEEQLGEAWSQIVAAIKDGDIDSAWRVIEYIEGKPKGSLDIKHSGGIMHAVFNPKTVRELAAQEQEIDMIKSQRLLGRLPAGVVAADAIDAEVVGDVAEGVAS